MYWGVCFSHKTADSDQKQTSGLHTAYITRYVNVPLGYFTLFLPRDASAERGNATVSRPSVCLSVCP